MVPIGINDCFTSVLQLLDPHLKQGNRILVVTYLNSSGSHIN
jgi:hypothetical protein